jgi:hypothetical protein
VQVTTPCPASFDFTLCPLPLLPFFLFSHHPSSTINSIAIWCIQLYCRSGRTSRLLSLAEKDDVRAMALQVSILSEISLCFLVPTPTLQPRCALLRVVQLQTLFHPAILCLFPAFFSHWSGSCWCAAAFASEGFDSHLIAISSLFKTCCLAHCLVCDEDLHHLLTQCHDQITFFGALRLLQARDLCIFNLHYLQPSLFFLFLLPQQSGVPAREVMRSVITSRCSSHLLTFLLFFHCHLALLLRGH